MFTPRELITGDPRQKKDDLDHCFAFGLDVAKVAGQLRRLADEIEANDVIIKKITPSVCVSGTDFVRTRLMLEYFEKFTIDPAAPSVGEA